MTHWYAAFIRPFVLSVLLTVVVFALLSPSEVFDWTKWNRSMALAGLLLVSIVFLLGPLSRLWPHSFARFLGFRKPLGIIAVFFIILHSAYSLVDYYHLDIARMLWDNPKLTGFIAALGALLIFGAMTLTSTHKAMQQMGYSRWKKLQQTGYLALALTIIHFVVLKTRAAGFNLPPVGWAVLFIAVLALVLRTLMLISTKPVRTHFDAHFDPAHAPPPQPPAKGTVNPPRPVSPPDTLPPARK